MRILHLDTGRELRGGQRQVLLLMRELRREGAEQALLAREGGPLLEAARAEGFDARPATLGAVFMRSGGVEIVHCHDGRSHTLAAIASRRKFVVSRRVAFPVGRRWPDRWKYSRAAAYLAVSEYAAAQLIAAGVPEGKIQIVRDAIVAPETVSDYTGGVAALDMDDPLKGGELLRSIRTPVRLVKDLGEGLRTASVFLYLSRMEGLGSAALLAMAYGVPVVASRVGGLPEVVRHGEHGFCVGNGVDEVDEALRSLIEDPARARAMGSRARQWVMEECGAERIVRRTLEIYRENVR